MKTKDLIEEIQKIPIKKRLLVIERSMCLIRKQEEEQMKMAAAKLYTDYLTANELTAFTNLDAENFYETR
ncbi:hypothetical protein [Hugenholtzia roseola]|uniref:hypothetical protein n=1 Tax=Hugenholtzia roseola TaxID=1002 RepID=UPI00047A6691|nr:hypothetical protein [Hugenholtzia roseola]